MGRNLAWIGVRAVHVLVFLLPALLVVTVGLRAGGHPDLFLLLSGAFQIVLLACFGFLIQRRRLQSPGMVIILLYAAGLVCLGLRIPFLLTGEGGMGDWFAHLAFAMLVIVALAIFVRQVLAGSGVSEIRRARLLARRLANRQNWPAKLNDCRMLPEVKALREALHLDATPALELLGHPRPEVRTAALAALEFRQRWRPGQAELVLHAAQNAPEIPVRVAAVAALGNLDDQLLVQTLAEFLRDSAREVRRTALETLLWDIEHRWTWIRDTIHSLLGDPAFKEDGPLPLEGRHLTSEAVTDLTAWTGEKGVLGTRAALTLAAHYSQVLQAKPDEGLIQTLHQQLANSHTPAILRLELARLLQDSHELDHHLQEQLLNPINPAPLRLVAAEALLANVPTADRGNEENEGREGALAALRDLARLPNREIALATAAVVQRWLEIDLGLALNQPLPPVHSRQAAEVVRRVMRWAAQNGSGLNERVKASAAR